jgi:homoserine acetyltransferase
MNAWTCAETYPDAMDDVVPVVAFPIRVSGRILFWRRMAIKMIQSDPLRFAIVAKPWPSGR